MFLSSCVVPKARALSLASPAPAPIAVDAAKGSPTYGSKDVIPNAPKEPNASPNLRGTESSNPGAALVASNSKKSFTPFLAFNSVSSPKGVIAPRAADSNICTAPALVPFWNSFSKESIPGSVFVCLVR